MLRIPLRSLAFPAASLGCALVVCVALAGCGGTSDTVPTSSDLNHDSGAKDDTTRADTLTMQSNIRYNLKQLNAYRAGQNLEPLELDGELSEFARQGSLELMRTHVPHGHFSSAGRAGTLFSGGGFRAMAAENQGDPNGWTPMKVNAAIDAILRAMIAEGPGGGHYDNIMNPALKRVGIGLVLDPKGQLYFTNDFSG